MSDSGLLDGRPDAGTDMWYRDTVSCLQASVATVLARHGYDPLEVLGLHWEFRYRPGDVRPEEFYYPCRPDGDLVATLAPHHPVVSCWHDGAGADPDRPLEPLAGELAEVGLVIAAVDNFHLPFRPAFGDVHAAHLLVLHALDPAAGTVWVSDPMPPAFRGAVAVEDFLRAWSSGNPGDEQDVFFSDVRMNRRYLAIRFAAPFPALDRALLHRALGHSLAVFGQADGHGGDWIGLTGVRRYLHAVRDRAGAGDSAVLRDLYPFGWGMQAQASLHGELLRRWGARHRVAEVGEAGRLVETVAHAWTGLRMCAAHHHDRPLSAEPELSRHARLLGQAYESAVAGLAEARAAL